MTPAGRPPRRIDNPELRRQLTAASRKIQRHRDAIAQLEPERDALICQAVADGWPFAQIAEATGLHVSRVGQISKN